MIEKLKERLTELRIQVANESLSEVEMLLYRDLVILNDHVARIPQAPATYATSRLRFSIAPTSPQESFMTLVSNALAVTKYSLAAEAVANLYLYADTMDYLILHQVLQYFTCTPGFCRIVCIGASSSRVYRITLPQWRPDDSLINKGCLAIDSEKAHFAVKVIHNDDEFLDEALMLHTVTEALQSDPDASVEHYALGYWKCSTDPNNQPVFFNDQWKQFFENARQIVQKLFESCDKKVSMSRDGWWHKAPAGEPTGGVIFMRVGIHKYADKTKGQTMVENKKAVETDVLKCLRRYFAVGAVHRDLRSTNVMFFPAETVSYTMNMGPVVSKDNTKKVTKKVTNKRGSSKRDSWEASISIPRGGWQLIDASLAGFLQPVEENSAGASRSRQYRNNVNSSSSSSSSCSSSCGGGGDDGHGGDCKRQKLDNGIFDGVRVNELTEPRWIHIKSGQFKDAGSGVIESAKFAQRNGDEFLHNWTISDDLSMLERMLQELDK